MFSFPPYLTRPTWVIAGALADLDFVNRRNWGGGFDSLLSISRASSGTSMLPASPAGASYLTFASNILRIAPGSGLLIEEMRTNVLLNSTSPATQTTGSLATGTYTLWANGAGSATVAAGTATGSGFGTATNGNPVTFALSGAGTVVVTVSGSLNAFQLEAGAFGTSLIITAGASATRATDNIQIAGALLAAFTGPGTRTAFLQYIQGPFGSQSAPNRQYGVNFNDSGNSRWTLRLSDTSASPQFALGDGASVSGLFDSGTTVAAGAPAKLAWRWSTTGADAAFCLNGRAPVAGARQAAAALTRPLYLGGNNGASTANHIIQRLAIIPGAPNMQVLTQ